MNFEDLKPGDQVSTSLNPARPWTVSRVTRTQILLSGTNIRFRRRDGWQVGELFGKKIQLRRIAGAPEE